MIESVQEDVRRPSAGTVLLYMGGFTTTDFDQFPMHNEEYINVYFIYPSYINKYIIVFIYRYMWLRIYKARDDLSVESTSINFEHKNL